jgi:asparagine synthase (glutamine-hydrolysing)
MSAILAIIGSDGRVIEDAQVARMLGRMASRGSAHASVWREGGVVIAVSRNEWELGPGFSGPALVVQDGDLIVAADASIYYRDDLKRKLAVKGVQPKGSSSSHLILAAYQAFGEKCPEILEGDFSFIIWDRKARKVFCSRDHSGQRPLFYAELGNCLVIASAIGAILEHPRCDGKLNLAALAVDAAGMIYSGYEETCYRGVYTAPAGSALSRNGDGQIGVSRWWDPPKREPARPDSTANAAEELVSILSAAVKERIGAAVSTSIWLSGGWDSTAVFAAGQKMLNAEGKHRRLYPISVSYPPGDSGREDERIAAVGAMWNVPINWVDIADVPLFGADAQRLVAERDEPYAHVYEQWTRTLCRSSLGANSRIALNGHGGDLLFQVSPVYLADLLARGKVLTLARHCRSMGMSLKHYRYFFQWVLQPLLSDRMLSGFARIRGRYLRGYFERPVPLWMRTPFTSAHQLAERGRSGTPRAPSGSHAAYEAYWCLTQPFFSRINSFIAGYALEEGVEIRTPFYDRRIIEFALTRPIRERNTAGEQKLLLRHAMRNLLPVEVLAPRPIKTGTLGGYFGNSMRDAASVFDSAFKAPELAKLGIVDSDSLRRAVRVYLRGAGDLLLGEQLFTTLQAELWLRAKSNTKKAETYAFQPGALAATASPTWDKA